MTSKRKSRRDRGNCRAAFYKAVGCSRGDFYRTLFEFFDAFQSCLDALDDYYETKEKARSQNS